MFLRAALLLAFLLKLVVGQLSLSSYNYTAVEGSDITVTCTHAANAAVSLSGLSSTWVITSFVSPYTDTVFTIQNVSRVDNNKQFTCTQGGVQPSSPAQINVLYLTLLPQFPPNWNVTSTPGLFYFNITVIANPFVIPRNITVVPPSGVNIPAFNEDSVVGDTGTEYVVVNGFQLPEYAGNYSIYISHPAVGTTVIRFSLTVLYAPRFTYSTISTNGTTTVPLQPGDPANFSCAATGVPQPSITGLSPSYNNATNAYTFPNVTQSNAGSYICLASNTVGSNTFTYVLNVGAATTPTPTPVSNPTGTPTNGVASMLSANLILCILAVVILL